MPDALQQTPVAWAFYYPDGTLRFIVDDEARMKAWLSAHAGPVVPLVPQPKPTA